ncbi:MAG: M48 family metalloprotease [Pseudomonadota bacterium]|nr:M48 family metalloprotease [Pseudomonadota bacterium]
MKIYLFFLTVFITLFLQNCSIKKNNNFVDLPNISLEEEEKEIFLQKKILINEMTNASKLLHQIAWPILKHNKDICYKEGSFSFGVIFAAKEDLPKKDSRFFVKIFNKNIAQTFFKKYGSDSFPVVISVAKESPADQSNILEGDIILKINNVISTTNFRNKLKKAFIKSSKLSLTILRNGKILSKDIKGIKICNYNIQPIPSPAPNAFADGEKIFITLAAIKLAKSVDELAFLIGHELAHNIFHYNYTKGSEANSLSINYSDLPKIKSLNSFFMYSTQSREIEADLKGIELAFRGGYSLDNVNDYWRRLSVFNPDMIASPSTIYKSNALRAIMISKTLKKLKSLNGKK